MKADALKGLFARMGARLQFEERASKHRSQASPLTLDVRSDAAGEFFDIRLNSLAGRELDVVDLRRRERHLLLRARLGEEDQFYLCGHDEQHWFVAAIPEQAGRLTSVSGAMEALKPLEVLDAQRRQAVKGKDRQRRKNAAYVRQGEWFFLPVPRLHVEKKQILHNEPLSRGAGSKPHWAEFLFRRGGELVYVCDAHPQGLSSLTYHALLRSKPRARSWKWRIMARNPEAYVKGRVSHPDHKTILLQVWHRVVMNTEGQSKAMRHVVFLD